MVRPCTNFPLPCTRKKGRPRKTWSESVKTDVAFLMTSRYLKNCGWNVLWLSEWRRMVQIRVGDGRTGCGSQGLRQIISLMTSFMGPTLGPSGADRTQVGPMLAPWILLSGVRSAHCAQHVTYSMFDEEIMTIGKSRFSGIFHVYLIQTTSEHNRTPGSRNLKDSISRHNGP